ncbi:MAG: hypothetical protein HY821_07335 [Acidobacteria bacterium]|nr:hypothetical protein [Acidobacteriota bacterium]
MKVFRIILLAVCAFPLAADVSQCACDPAKPETMKARECSLCVEAGRHTAEGKFFVLKDNNPRKPNRWLVLPVGHTPGPHHMHEMPKAERAEFWQSAIRLGKEKFGEEWGVAYNGWKVRTQCHAHIHVGHFIQAAENSNFKLVRRVEEFPTPEDAGLWIHPVEGGFHVHAGEQIAETVLVR